MVMTNSCALSTRTCFGSPWRSRDRPAVGRFSCCTDGPTRLGAGAPSLGGCRSAGGGPSCLRCVARVRLGSAPRRRRGTDAGSRLPVTRSTSWTHSASTVSPSSATTGAHASPTRWPRSRRSARRDRRARASLSARGVFTVPAFQLREDRCLDPRNGEPVRDATRPPPGRGVRGRRRGLKRVRAGRPSAR
jgi:hypothetical protein